MRCADTQHDHPTHLFCRPTNPVAHAVFTLGAALGNELFFISFLPMLFWVFDVNVARGVCLQWVVTFYVGQFWKDTTKLPRPPNGQGVVRLEKHYEHEYGMPSTHASNGIAMPWYIVYLSWERFAGPRVILVALASFWTLSCLGSRMYMGVHSPADLVTGSALGVTLLAAAIAWAAPLDAFLMTSAHSVWVLPLLACLLVAVYPRPRRPYWLNSPGDTTLIIGAWLGIAAGSALSYDAHMLRANAPITGPESLQAAVAMLPFLVVGLVALMVTRAVVKGALMAVAKAVVAPLYGPASDESINPPVPVPVPAKVKPAAADADGDGKASLPPPLSTGGDRSRSDGSSPRSDPGSLSSRDGAGNGGSGSGADEPAPVAETPTGSKSTGVTQAPADAAAFVPGTPTSGSSSSGNGLRHRAAAAAVTAPPAAVEASPPPSGASSSSSGGRTFDPGFDGKGSSRTPGPGLVLVPLAKRYDVELPVKIVTYAAVGVATTYLIPLTLQKLGVKDYGY